MPDTHVDIKRATISHATTSTLQFTDSTWIRVGRYEVCQFLPSVLLLRGIAQDYWQPQSSKQRTNPVWLVIPTAFPGGSDSASSIGCRAWTDEVGQAEVDWLAWMIRERGAGVKRGKASEKKEQASELYAEWMRVW
jgi:hypothetical protein